MANFLFDLIKKRRSIRKFKSQAVEQEKIDLLMKTVLMSPSSKSTRPWHFIVVDDKEMLVQLSESRTHGSQLIAGAAAAVIVIADSSKTDVWIEDASIASAYLQLQAENIGLGSCWVQVRGRMKNENITTEDEIRNLLNIPEEYKVLNMIALGYKDEEKNPHNEEKILYERVHKGKF